MTFDWSAEPCVIVASGPSAMGVPLDMAKGKAKFIAINRSWELCPWADVLYGCDSAFWRKFAGVPAFAGLKLCSEQRSFLDTWGVRHVAVATHTDRILMGQGKIGAGGHSGFQAVNLALQWLCRAIVLVGFDLRIDLGIHWHGAHPAGMNNPNPGNIGRMRRSLDDAAVEIGRLGARVINASPMSALANYPKMSFEAACREMGIA